MTTAFSRSLFLSCFVFISRIAQCQDYYPDSLATLNNSQSETTTQVLANAFDEYRREAITVGILQGGGSLIGADYELLFSDEWGFQVGAGLIGLGAGINYHFEKNNIRSSFASLQIWNQGIGDSFTQRIMGPVYVYRSKKWFTASLGIGAVLDRRSAFPENIERTPVILMYSIGGYFLK